MSGFRLPAAGWRVDFEDPERSFAAKTNFELARSLLIFNVCAVPPLVQNASILYKAATRALGQQLPDTVIRASFFRHFCGGESESDLMPVMKRLGDNGVGAILDYAAEADVDSAPRGDHAAQPGYAGEADCDDNAAIVVSSIDAAAAAATRGGRHRRHWPAHCGRIRRRPAARWLKAGREAAGGHLPRTRPRR